MQIRFVAATVALSLALAVPVLTAGGASAFPWGKKKDKEPPPAPVTSQPLPAWAQDGNPAYPAGFSRFEYVSPYAEKGGQMRLGEIGGVKGFNPYGTAETTDRRAAAGLIRGPFEGYVFESLMARGRDERLALYGLLAQSIEVASDLSFVGFALNPAAKFSNGNPVTAEDVLFSFETARAHGQDSLKADLGFVTAAASPAPGKVRFGIAPGAPAHLPAILGLMPILPKQVYAKVDFAKAGFKSAPVGSGPYTASISGDAVIYRRRANYWGAALPTRKGYFNFDTVSVTYFPSRAAMLSAFKDGRVQVWIEDNPALWESELNFYKIRSGVIYKEEYRRRTQGEGDAAVDRIARWVDLDRPQRAPFSGALVDSWWSAETH